MDNSEYNQDDSASIGQMFEFLLTEWHVTPDYISNNWSNELLAVMVEKLVERKRKVNQNVSMDSRNDDIVSDEVLFSQMGQKIQRG